VNIANLLDKAGFKEIEIGTPAMGSEEILDIRSIINLGLDLKHYRGAAQRNRHKQTRAQEQTVHIFHFLYRIYICWLWARTGRGFEKPCMNYYPMRLIILNM
jgi:isopropylmalate/homocitrate/citramalate synthase